MSTTGDASRRSHNFHSKSDFNDDELFESRSLVDNEYGNKKVSIAEHDAPDKGEKSRLSEKEEKEKKNELPPVGFISLFRYSNCWDKTLVIIGTMVAVASGAAMPAITVGYGKIIDTMITYDAANRNTTNVTMTTDEFLSETAFWCAYNGAFGFYNVVCSYIMVSFFSLAAANQAFRIKCLFMASILKQDIAWYDTEKTGDFASLISGDLSRIQTGIGEKVCICISSMTSAILCACLGFSYSWSLALVILSLTPVVTFVKGFMLKIQASVSREEMKAYGTAAAVAEEVLSSIRTVAAFGGEKKEIQRYDNCLVPAGQKGMKRGLLTALSSSITYFCFFLGYALAFWYGIKLVIEGSLTGGTLLTVFFNINTASTFIGQTTPYFEAFAVAKGAAAKIYNIIDRVPSIDSSSKEGKEPHSVKGTISIRSAYFNYPARPGVPILKNVSLDVQPGETVALVGPSGCGKSTIIQLILRFYDVDQGAVHLDENNVKDLNVGWLRDHIGLVGQEPVLFSTTIAENIRYGKLDATQEEIENAAKIANVHDFIRALPMKYGTLVGERGIQLSGGQKQRIAIARALVKNPKVLLLDEATSALDTESESIVQAALDEASQGRTTIVVAHRLSTIRTADKIVVLCEGIVKEVGTHEELMKKEGTYFNLVQAQSESSKQKREGEELDELDKREEDMIKELGWKLSALSGNSAGSNDGSQTSARRQRFSSIASSRSWSSARGGYDRTHSHRSDEFELQMSANSDAKEIMEDVEDDKLGQNAPPSKLRLWKISASEWPYALVGGIAAFLMGIHLCFFAIIFGDILGALSGDPSKIREETNVFCLIFLILAFTAALCNFLQVFMFTVVAEKLASKLRKMIFSNIIAQNLEYFDHPNNGVGSLCARLTSDVSGVQGATGSRISILLQATSTLIASVVLAFWFEYRIGVVALACIPYVFFAVYFEGKVVRDQAARDKLGTEGASKVAIEAIEAIRTVASLHQEEIFLSKFRYHLFGPYRKSRTQSHVRGIVYGFVQGLSPFTYAATLFYGSKLIAWKMLQFADLLKVIRATLMGAKEIGQAVALAPDFQKAQVSAERIFQLLEIKPKIDAFSTEGTKLEKINGHISFKKVNFTYPSRPNVKILRGFDLEIEPGKTVALVGSSGCGKSTCLQLLERFYDPNSGSVFLDNTDVGAMNVSNLRSHLGLVSQEPVLFSYSIAENIAYGDNSRQVNMSEIVEAARKANIHNFIRELPQGYETPVGDKGTQLSGGQKQRVAIARALLRNPKILLLDEATSALDAESEKIVQDALDKARSGRTCLIIAHRLTTIQSADVIMVIHKGRIVEQGTHQELLNTKGHYYNLHNTQSSVK